MNYFDKDNEAMRPYAKYDSYVLYNIDTKNKTAGVELYFDDVTEVESCEMLIMSALKTAFDELELNKIYVNVIRDNYGLFNVLDRFNFITESIHRGQYFDGNMHDVVYMTVMKTEWKLGGIKYNYSYGIYDIEIK